MLSCHLFLLTQLLTLAHQHLLGFFEIFLSFGFEGTFSAFFKMSEDKKAVAGRFWKACLKILVIATVMMWKVVEKTPKIDPALSSIHNRTKL